MNPSLVLSGRGQGTGGLLLPPSTSRLPPDSGFALVATLLMITVITGAAVAFFQSTRIERFVARNYADLARAQLAAEGGAAAGQALITSLFTNYPDSAVGWARLADTELATFYFRTTNANGFLTNGANAATPRQPTRVSLRPPPCLGRQRCPSLRLFLQHPGLHQYQHHGRASRPDRRQPGRS